MQVDYESRGIWSATIERQVATVVQPGVTLHITGIALPHVLKFTPQGGWVRSVLRLTHKNPRGVNTDPEEEEEEEEEEITSTIATLIPEKQEHIDCDIVLPAGGTYKFEVNGNPVHLVGNYEDTASTNNPNTTVRRIISPRRIQSQRSSSTVQVDEADRRSWGYKAR